MPWIRTLRLARWLYVAWVENDLHEMTEQRLGWSAEHATNRIVKRWDL
jgi:hypothetical protein